MKKSRKELVLWPVMCVLLLAPASVFAWGGFLTGTPAMGGSGSSGSGTMSSTSSGKGGVSTATPSYYSSTKAQAAANYNAGIGYAKTGYSFLANAQSTAVVPRYSFSTAANNYYGNTFNAAQTNLASGIGSTRSGAIQWTTFNNLSSTIKANGGAMSLSGIMNTANNFAAAGGNAGFELVKVNMGQFAQLLSAQASEGRNAQNVILLTESKTSPGAYEAVYAYGNNGNIVTNKGTWTSDKLTENWKTGYVLMSTEAAQPTEFGLSDLGSFVSMEKVSLSQGAQSEEGLGEGKALDKAVSGTDKPGDAARVPIASAGESSEAAEQPAISAEDVFDAEHVATELAAKEQAQSTTAGVDINALSGDGSAAPGVVPGTVPPVDGTGQIASSPETTSTTSQDPAAQAQQQQAVLAPLNRVFQLQPVTPGTKVTSGIRTPNFFGTPAEGEMASTRNFDILINPTDGSWMNAYYQGINPGFYDTEGGMYNNNLDVAGESGNPWDVIYNHCGSRFYPGEKPGNALPINDALVSGEFTTGKIPGFDPILEGEGQRLYANGNFNQAQIVGVVTTPFSTYNIWSYVPISDEYFAQYIASPQAYNLPGNTNSVYLKADDRVESIPDNVFMAVRDMRGTAADITDADGKTFKQGRGDLAPLAHFEMMNTDNMAQYPEGVNGLDLFGRNNINVIQSEGAASERYYYQTGQGTSVLRNPATLDPYYDKISEAEMGQYYSFLQASRVQTPILSKE